MEKKTPKRTIYAGSLESSVILFPGVSHCVIFEPMEGSLMAWFRKRGEPKQKKWSNRVERERQELSASVEESLADVALQEEWLDEDDEGDDNDVVHAEASPVIPPRLSLQSRQLPALRLAIPGIVEGTAVPTPVTMEPASRLLHPAEAAPSGKASRRLSHTTKVRLQMVSKPQIASTPRQESDILPEPTTSLDLSAVKVTERDQESPENSAILSGNGVIESGQSEIGVTNGRITEQSVVIVMLSGDPGPVVVQYVSLQPRYGFTVHLSASAVNTTPFNYAILNSL
jgi:hypothetical protein